MNGREWLGGVVLIWLLTGGCSQPEPLNAYPSLVRVCIAEPIFAGEVCFHEANRAAGKSVVLIHGLNGEAERDWQYQFGVLARDYHVLALDLPGSADSSPAEGHYTPENYARLLRFITERRVGRPAHLVGHSMGAAIALYYSALYPEQVARLVLVDVAGVLHPVALSKSLARGWVTGSTSGSSGLGGWVERMTGRVMEKLSPAVETVGEGWLEDDTTVRAARGLVATDFSSLFARVTVPTLLLWGADDTIAPLRTAQVLQRRLPSSTLVVIEGGGHMVMQEQAEVFNQRLGQFLRGESPATGQPSLPIGPSVDLGREADCQAKSGLTFSGHYSRIRLNHCNGIVIRDAQVGSIEAVSSQFYLEGSQVGGGAVGMALTASDATLTASAIRGEVALRASGSRVDMAGVDLIGSVAAIEARHRTRLIFSVTRLQSPVTDGYLHANLRVTRERRF